MKISGLLFSLGGHWNAAVSAWEMRFYQDPIGNLKFLKESSRKLCKKSIFEEERIYKCHDRFMHMYFWELEWAKDPTKSKIKENAQFIKKSKGAGGGGEYICIPSCFEFYKT